MNPNREHPGSASAGHADDADRQEFLTRLTLGEDPISAAKEIGIPFSLVAEWLRDVETTVEVAELQNRFSQSLGAHGAALVSNALETLQAALTTGDWTDAANNALKIVMASGVLGAMLPGAPTTLEQRVQARELADRLRFLEVLRTQGMTEAEWQLLYGQRQAVGATGTGRPRGRPRKVRG